MAMTGAADEDFGDETAQAKRRFLAFWNALYPETPPVGHMFKHHLSARWARIHTLPNSKRYAENEAERRIVALRQRGVIDHLVRRGTAIRIVVNFIEIDNPLFAAFAFENIGVIVDRPLETVFQSFQLEARWPHDGVMAMLAMIAEDTMRAFLIAPDCLIAPYDGGMDVILKDADARAAFRQHFGAWLSARPDGL